MRKLLLVLPILAFPLIAQAADEPTHAPEAMIQAQREDFYQNFVLEK